MALADFSGNPLHQHQACSPVLKPPLVYLAASMELLTISVGAIKKMESKPPDPIECLPPLAGILGAISMLLMALPGSKVLVLGSAHFERLFNPQYQLKVSSTVIEQKTL